MPKPNGDSKADRPAALMLSPEAPYPAVGGGALRTASLLHYLAERYTVDLIVFREPGAPDPSSALPGGLVRNVHTLALPNHGRSRLARAMRNANRLLRSVPPLTDRFSGFGAVIERQLSGRRYEVAVIEHFWCAPYHEQLASISNRVVLDLHNIESDLHARSSRAEPWPVSPAHRRFHAACLALERAWLPRFSFLLATSSQDAERLRKIAPGCQVCVYPNTVPWAPPPAGEAGETIVFSGNLEYHPNTAAVRFFRFQVWPLLRAERPSLRWRVVGKNPQAVRAWLNDDPRIELVGPVEDAIEALALSQVAVVPLLAGSGTRVKILEAWAASLPVVSTTIGAEGLSASHGEHLLVADDPADFARTVSALLADGELRRRLGTAGRRLYEERYTWQAGWNVLAGLHIL